MEREQLKLLYGAVTASVFNPVVASMVAVGLWPVFPAWALLGWLALFCAVVAARFMDRNRYLRPSPTGWPRPASDWRWRYTLGCAATGALWGGLAALVALTRSDPIYQVLLSFAIGGMLAGAILQQAVHLPAFYAYATCAVVPPLAATPILRMVELFFAPEG